MDLENIFGNMERASVTDKGTFFTHGLYLCTIESIEFRNGYKGQSVITKFRVEESNSTETSVGETRSWILKLDKPKTKDQALGDLKSLVFAALGFNPREVGSPDKNPGAHKQAVDIFKANIDPAKMAELTAAMNAAGKDPAMLVLKGRKVRLEATEVVTAPSPDRPAGGKFTRHAWTPYKA